MHVSVTCTWNDRGPDVTMTVGQPREEGSAIISMGFTAEDAVKYGQKLIQEGEKAIKLRSGELSDEVQADPE